MGTKDKKSGRYWGRAGAPPEHKATVMAYVEAGHSLSDAKDKFGNNTNTIRGWFKAAGKDVPKAAIEAGRKAKAHPKDAAQRRPEEWDPLIAQYKASGLSQTAFAKQVGVNFKALNGAIMRQAARLAKAAAKGEQLALPTVAPVAPRQASPPRVTPQRPTNGDYGDVGGPGPSSYSALEDALREAIRERQALRTTLDIFQRENEALRRKLGFGGER